MTDIVSPSFNKTASSFETAGTVQQSGVGAEYIVPSTQPTQLAIVSGLNDSNFTAFTESHSSSSLDLTVNAGESFIYGAWVARDSSTTVTLPTNVTDETVYLGWDKSLDDTAIIGRSGSFGTNDPKIPLYDVTTDGTGITSVTDRRVIGSRVDVDVVDAVFSKHSTTIDDDYVIESGEGVVIAGPLTGSGSISGDGRLVVL